MKVHLDFETYSECDLKKHGAWVYSKHPSTRVLCMYYAVDEGEVKTLQKQTMSNISAWIRLTINNKEVEFVAANSFFECCIIANTLGFGEDAIDFNQWHDTLALACAAAWPQSLGMITSKLPFPEELRKDKRGNALIQKLCKPQKLTTAKDSKLITPEEKWGDEYQELFTQLCDYCAQDVVSERAVHNKLRPLSSKEREVWVEDQKINWRGMKCDVGFAKKAYSLYQDVKAEELAEIKQIAGLDNPNSRPQVLKWLRAGGLDIDDLQSATLEEMLKDDELTDDERRVIELRLTSARTPPSKYLAMLARADRQDHRIRDLVAYHAATTGRSASRGVNLMNLPRPIFKDYDWAVDVIQRGDADEMRMFYGSPITTLCSAIRPALIAEEGHRLVDCDFSSIEARVIAWLANQTEILDVFNGHGKVYEYTATKIYHKELDDITPEERFIGKTATLALGYQGGYRAFMRMAKNYDVDIPKSLAEETVTKWRKANPRIVKFWYACNDAAMYAVKSPGQTIKVGSNMNSKVAFKSGTYQGLKYLWCRLPSGRLLSYVLPSVKMGDYGPKIVHKGIDSFTRQWTEIGTYGGKLAENITQAVARDIMVEAILRLRGTVYDKVVLTVYDQIVSEVENGVGSVDEMVEIMCRVPAWAKGLPIAADGSELERLWK